jgi:hypothetical protein
VSSHERGNGALTAAGAQAACSKLEFARISSVIAEVVRAAPT